MKDFTVVIGVDTNHIPHLEASLPTWLKNKPSISDHPFVVFYDRDMGTDEKGYLGFAVGQVSDQVTLVPWPPKDGVSYPGIPGNKWTDPQRYKMFSGFVHVPGAYVKTKYWLKLDLDAVATGRDNWIDPNWFEGDPVIVAHRWGYTKPPNQMVELDKWVARHETQLEEWAICPPLNLVPKPGANAVGHTRIISWCGFFQTAFTRRASQAANETCGEYQLPVPSQDGYLWYLAKRANHLIKTPNMKKLGWQHLSRLSSVRQAAREALLQKVI